MSVGEVIGLGFLAIVCLGFGGVVGYLICLQIHETRKVKRIDKFLRKKLSAKDYLKLQDFMMKEVEEVAPIIIFLQTKLNASDFQRYVELAEIKDIEEGK